METKAANENTTRTTSSIRIAIQQNTAEIKENTNTNKDTNTAAKEALKASELTVKMDNKAFIPTVEIKYIGWLTRSSTIKSASSVIVEICNLRVPFEKRHGHTLEVRGMPRRTRSVARPVPNQDTGISQNQSGIQTTTKVPPGSHSSPNRHRNSPNNPDDIEASTGTEPEPEHTPGA
ncbi:hypothetical protein CSUB01_12086 [Colletotrichum sublineola]|uniref:Uncharacterized protein n=1 Tax=Colletotrichum sublineola TaxID=1173701 RepID=A0A066X8T3_COLSU|nr:hypothetical protein CSUB01_12086 [Colletotrichum sublineola]